MSIHSLISPPPSTSGGQPGPPPGGRRGGGRRTRSPGVSVSGGQQGPPSGGRGIRPPPCYYTFVGRPRPSEKDLNNQTDSERPNRPTVRAMRSSPRVVDLPDSSDIDIDFNEEWLEIDLNPADFVVPPPVPETADAATCTPLLPEPELSAPPITIQQLARRTATVMAGRRICGWTSCKNI